MNKIEKLKVAVDVALYYFTINTVFYFLTVILPYLRYELTLGLGAYAIPFAPLVVAIIFLVTLSNVLKGNVQGRINIFSKTSIFIIVGVLLIITAVIRISSYVSLIGVLLEHSSLKNAIYITVVPIVISVVQIGTGAYLTLINIKRDKQIEKIKVAVDVAIYYFTITIVLNLLSKIFSDLLYRSNRQLIEGLKSNTLHYVVVTVVIMFLVLYSNVLKRKLQGVPNIDNKTVVFIIVGVLLIITGISEIPTQIAWVYSNYNYSIDKGISQEQKTQFINYIYWATVQMVFSVFQIGIGAYFTLMTKKRNDQKEETG